MFSDVCTRLKQRAGPSARVTEADVAAQRATTDALRQQLKRIVDDEIAPNNEACAVATNGMVMLRNETDERRRDRDGLSDALEAARRQLAALQVDCARENERWQKCASDAARMEGEAARARKEHTLLQAEMDQAWHLQESVDAETMHRLRADVENLKIEHERESIRMRHLTNERRDLTLELQTIRAQRDAHKIVEADQQRELEETRMTQGMYRAHQEALTLHLRNIGGDPGLGRFGFGSFSEFFNKYKQDVCHQKQPAKRIPKADDNIRRSMRSRPQVGGVFFGADTAAGGGTGGGESANFLRKLPTVFKMGGNRNTDTAAPVSRQEDDYVLRRFTEVEFSKDFSSNVSILTMDGDETWKDSLCDTEEEPC